MPPFSVELTNCSFCVVMVWHFDKSEPAILSKRNVNPNLRVGNGAVLREKVLQIVLRGVAVKVRYEDLHRSSCSLVIGVIRVTQNWSKPDAPPCWAAIPARLKPSAGIAANLKNPRGVNWSPHQSLLHLFQF